MPKSKISIDFKSRDHSDIIDPKKMQAGFDPTNVSDGEI